MRIVGIDPGRHKVGVALICRETGETLHRAVVPAQQPEELAHLLSLWDAQVIAVGDATGGVELLGKLKTWQLEKLIPPARLLQVDEKNSTLEARCLYWKVYRPTGWRRFVPLSLQTPPVPVDDFAAVVLAQRAALTLDLPGKI